jgi:enoyl-CoA hydratase
LSTEPVTVRRDGALLDSALNQPHNGNLLSAAMGRIIIDALARLDDEIRLVRLSGVGADFCAGRESPTPPKGGHVPSAETLRRLVAAPALELYDAIKLTKVPVLGVVQGKAIGVGCALAGVCDVVIAASDAVFQVPEMERDIPPTLVMSALIGRVPVKTVARLVLTRDFLSAHDALQAGLLSQVVELSQLNAEADRLTAIMLGCGPVAMRAVKQFLELAPGLSINNSSGLAAHLAATALSARY